MLMDVHLVCELPKGRSKLSVRCAGWRRVPRWRYFFKCKTSVGGLLPSHAIGFPLLPARWMFAFGLLHAMMLANTKRRQRSEVYASKMNLRFFGMFVIF